jgi:hypothetical protein
MAEANEIIKAEASTKVESMPPANNQAAAPQVDLAMKQAWNDLEKVDEIKQGAQDLKNAIIDIAGAKTTKAENVDIYAMPKEFQKHNAVAGSKNSVGLLVMSGALLLLLLVGSGAVLYYLKPELLSSLTGKRLANQEPEVVVQPVVEVVNVVEVATTTPEVMSTTTIAELMATSTPPKDIYLAYNIELARVNTFADYFSLINKYGSARRVQQVEAEKLLADVATDKGVSNVATVRKEVPVLDPLAKVEEKLTEQVASLAIALPDKQSSGTVDMIWENGSWKLDNEQWILPMKQEEIAYVAGTDRDSDGLTDKEEDLFGSNKESADSDSDGYSDAVEVSGLYDPNKKSAKLVDSGKLVTYLADDGSYSLIRPGEWSQSKDNTDNSINFHSADDHVISISTVENYDKLSLDKIYLKELKLSQIDSQLRMTNDTWTAIADPDGNKVWLVSKLDKSRYYILEYSVPSGGQTLEYRALFGAMLKSLVLKK